MMIQIKFFLIKKEKKKTCSKVMRRSININSPRFDRWVSVSISEGIEDAAWNIYNKIFMSKSD